MPRKFPEYVICALCKRRLDPHDYDASPDGDTPPENITVIVDPNGSRFSVQCSTCGHYTTFRPE